MAFDYVLDLCHCSWHFTVFIPHQQKMVPTYQLLSTNATSAIIWLKSQIYSFLHLFSLSVWFQLLIVKFSNASKHIPLISTHPQAGPGRAKLIVLKDCHLTPFTDFVSVSSLMCRLASAPIINQVLSHDNQIPKGVGIVSIKCDGIHVDNDFRI